MIHTKDIQTHQRRTPYLQEAKFLSYETARRAVDITIPFLNLHAPTAKYLSIGLGACNSVVELKTGYLALQARQWKACGCSVAKVAFLVASLAATILMPIAALLCTQGMAVATETNKFARSLFQKQYKEAIKSLGSMLSAVVYVGAALYALPELLFLSLVMQGGCELCLSYSELQRGRYLEAVANACLAAIRGYGAREHALTVQRNWLGKKVSQKDWESFLCPREGNKGSLDLEKSLIQGNFSSYIENIHSIDQQFDAITFTNIHFKKCNFTGSSFAKSVFHQVSFNTCELRNTSLMYAKLSHVTFQQCAMQGSNFYQVQSERLQFIASNLCEAIFNNSLHNKLMMQKCSLEGACFLHAQVKESTIRDSDLTNCILANCKREFSYKNCKEHKFTKPVIALTWNFKQYLRYTSKIGKALQEEGALVMFMEFSPDDVNPRALAEELAARKRHMQNVHFSIADELIRGSSVEMDKLQRKAQEAIDTAQGIVLSGGNDVESVFYHLDSQPELAADHRRSVFECMLIKVAKEKAVPLMAICRGSQIVNVYQGGTIKEVGWQEGAKELSYTSKSEKVSYFQQLLQDPKLYAYSNHHQAIDKLGQGLEILAQDGDIPKLITESTENGFMLLTQFHPEVYLEVKESKKEIFSSIQKAQRMLEQEGIDEKEHKQIAAFIDYFNHVVALENHHRFYKHFVEAVQARKRSQLKLWA